MEREKELEYNEKVSEEYRKTVEYQDFLGWCQKSGIRVAGVEFPAFYGEHGQLRGARASEDILPFQAIIAVPLKCLMMSRKAYDDPELSLIFSKHPQLFDPHKDDSASYMAVMFFMLRERIKGRDSELYHVWNIVPVDQSFPWLDDSMVAFIRDQCIIDEIVVMKNKLEYLWTLAKPVLDENTQVYPRSITRQEFNWAYYFSNSRCFGDSMPSLVYTPVIDLINHANKNAIFHCSFSNLKYESLTIAEAKNHGYDKNLGLANLSKLFPERKSTSKPQIKSEAVEFIEAVSQYVKSD